MLLHLMPEVLERVLNLYTQGMSVEEICDVVGMDPDEVNKVLDIYAQYLT